MPSTNPSSPPGTPSFYTADPYWPFIWPRHIIDSRQGAYDPHLNPLEPLPNEDYILHFLPRTFQELDAMAPPTRHNPTRPSARGNHHSRHHNHHNTLPNCHNNNSIFSYPVQPHPSQQFQTPGYHSRTPPAQDTMVPTKPAMAMPITPPKKTGFLTMENQVQGWNDFVKAFTSVAIADDVQQRVAWEHHQQRAYYFQKYGTPPPSPLPTATQTVGYNPAAIRKGFHRKEKGLWGPGTSAGKMTYFEEEEEVEEDQEEEEEGKWRPFGLGIPGVNTNNPIKIGSYIPTTPTSSKKPDKNTVSSEDARIFRHTNPKNPANNHLSFRISSTTPTTATTLTTSNAFTNITDTLKSVETNLVEPISSTTKADATSERPAGSYFIPSSAADQSAVDTDLRLRAYDRWMEKHLSFGDDDDSDDDEFFPGSQVGDIERLKYSFEAEYDYSGEGSHDPVDPYNKWYRLTEGQKMYLRAEGGMESSIPGRERKEREWLKEARQRKWEEEMNRARWV